MADDVTPSYGYAPDKPKESPFVFGLNANNTYLTKFEYIPNGGEGGAEADALEIIFKINGTDKSNRMFPVTKAFGKDREEITDPNSPEMKDAFTTFNAMITHILHVYQELDVIKSTFARPIKSFKEFCEIAASILPKDFATIKLDIFMQWQWQYSKDQTKTYLEIPNKMKHGRWLTKSTGQNWQELRLPSPTDNEKSALSYVVYEIGSDGKPTTTIADIHPFVRTGWFMNSKFAAQQRLDGDTSQPASTNGEQGAKPEGTPTGDAAAGTAAKAAW